MLDLVQVGFTQKTYGHKGEIKISMDLPLEALISEEQPFLFLQIIGSTVPYAVESYVELGEDYRVKFKYIESPEQASEYTHTPIYVERNRLPEDLFEEIPEDILRFTIVRHPDGKYIGQIEEILEYPQQYMLFVRSSNDQIHMIPWVESWIVALEPEAQIIKMQLPMGLGEEE